MNISQAAGASGVSAKMIRHYEQIGLIPEAKRTLSNYRTYAANEIHILRFIRTARDLGFSIRQIAELLRLWADRRRSSRRVKALTLEHIGELERKIGELRAMKATLEHLAHHCHGDERPDCPILDALERGQAGSSAARTRIP